MEQEEIYNNPKKTDEDNSDIGLGKKEIPGNRLTQISNKQFVKNILDALHPYYMRIDAMYPFYQETSKIIMGMDKFFRDEEKILESFIIRAKNCTLKESEIHNRINDINNKLSEFEQSQGYVRNKLRKIANTFHDKEDKNEHEKKINAFCSLFLDIYLEIEEITYDLDELRKYLK